MTHPEPLTLDIIKDRIKRGQPASRPERKWLVEALEDALLGESDDSDVENCWAESDADCERDEQRAAQDRAADMQEESDNRRESMGWGR